MKSVASICNPNRLALATVLSIVLSGCDGGSTVLITDQSASDPASDSANGVTVLDTAVDSSDPVANSASTDLPAAIGTATSVAIDSGTASNTVTVVENLITDNDASSGAVAADFLADRAALGAIKIMAVGDSITHGVSGVSSYRKEFTAQMESAACDFTMVGSQLTSDSGGGAPECEDTPPIGDGWGWDGSKSCLVGSGTSTDLYVGAHEGYSSHRADHFITGNVSSAGTNDGIQVAMETFTPDVVLLHIGSVDLFNQQTVGDALNDIEDMLTIIYETKPETLVLIANVIPWFSSNPYPAIGNDIVKLGDGVQKMVAERLDPLLKLVDVRSGFTQSMMLNDLIHPNATGEAHIADAFTSVYQPLANCSSL